MYIKLCKAFIRNNIQKTILPNNCLNLFPFFSLDMERRIRSLDLNVKPAQLEFAYVSIARKFLAKCSQDKPDVCKQMNIQREFLQAVALTIICDSKRRNENLSMLIKAYGLLLILNPKENTIQTTIRKVESSILSKYLSNYPLLNVAEYIFKMTQTSKKVLQDMRKSVSKKLNEAEDIGGTNDDITNERVLDDIRESIFKAYKYQISTATEFLVGIRAPPCGFAVVGVGSVAYGDVTPYSDIEIVILLENDDADSVNKSYFSWLYHMLTLVTMMLRETPVLRLGIQSIIEQLSDVDFHGDFKFGFTIDQNCYCIETPEVLCQQIRNASLADLDSHKYLWSVYLCGEVALVKRFHKIMTTFLNSKHDSGNGTIAQHKALQYIKVDLESWGYTLDHLRKHGGSFDVKTYLHRLPSLLIRSFALFSHIYNTALTEALVGIQSQCLLPRNIGNELKLINSLIFDTRLRVYNTSKSRNGYFRIRDYSDDKSDAPDVYYLHKETIDSFISIMDRIVAVLGAYVQTREVTEYDLGDFCNHLTNDIN